MPKKHTFTAKIRDAQMGGAYVEVPFDAEAAFGSKKPKVVATIDGEPYRGTLVRMKTDCHVLLVLKAIRERLGKKPGDMVKVTLELDDRPRVVRAPRDLSEAMKAEPAAAAFWKTLSYSHKREYVQWIEQAKKAETRQRRIAKAVEMLSEGRKSRSP